jgi:membrane protein implicated in regulation of membrane protease activity
MSFKIIFWYWWALAAVLLVFEIMLPGVVFMFLAIGAAASGAALLVIADLSFDATINARGDSMIGKTIVLDAPILNGRGRVKVGDGSWTVTGPDMVAGTRVRVTAVSGTELAVEPAR